MTRYGATPEEWAALKRLAKVDLLPVVSNPHAVISPHSKMKSKGKTPSRYNSAREVAGFPDWTDHETTVRNIEAWSAEDDYGICIQTRALRGLDIDVSDPARADEIEARALELLGLDWAPTRTRANSGKRLVVVKAEGVLDRASFTESEHLVEGTGKVKRELVELLGNGQQFIAAGQHPSGVRYEWRDGLPKPGDVPVVALQDLVAAWDALEAEFGLPGSGRKVGRRQPTLPEDIDISDPVAEWLVQSDWPTYSYERGMLYVECPGAAGHSTDNGETQTAWLLAGSGQYRRGHFRCMHAGCGEITDDKFFQAVGYHAQPVEEFDDLSGEVLAEATALYAKMAAANPSARPGRALDPRMGLPLPGFERDANGRILTSLDNITKCLRAVQAAQCEIAFDDFRGELMIAEHPGEWRSFRDADAVALRIRLEALGFKDRIGREMMRDALELVGDERHFDTAIEWLTNIVPAWDGVARIHRFWPDYMQTADTAYTRAVGNYSWTAQAGRILSPGCQADMVPVMVSDEGFAKTSVIAAIAPGREFFAEFNLQHDDDKLARLMRGTLVGELAELRGVAARDGEAVKSWVTRREEKWTPKFKEYATTMARRLVFYGTTNDPEFLQPHMGVRRWLPVTVLRKIDVAKIERDRLQLWAEARDVWMVDGAQWEDAERLALSERDSFKHVDPWHDKVAAWLDDEDDIGGGVTPRRCGHLRSEQVLSLVCGLDSSRIKKVEQQRIGEVLKNLGMVRIQRKLEGRNTKVWVDATNGEGP